MAKFKLFKDILTEVDPDGGKMYSQGRVYLLWSIIAYYLTLGVISYKAFTHKDIDSESLKSIVDALQWVLGLFAGYVFGSKGIDALKVVFAAKSGTITPPTNNPEEPKI